MWLFTIPQVPMATTPCCITYIAACKSLSIDVNTAVVMFLNILLAVPDILAIPVRQLPGVPQALAPLLTTSCLPARALTSSPPAAATFRLLLRGAPTSGSSRSASSSLGATTFRSISPTCPPSSRRTFSAQCAMASTSFCSGHDVIPARCRPRRHPSAPVQALEPAARYLVC